MTMIASEQAEVRDFLAHYAFRECRGESHQWRKQHRGLLVEGAGSFRIYVKHSICAECGTERFKRMTAQREQLQTRYKYCDGYKSEPGLAIKRADVFAYEIDEQEATEAAKVPAQATRTSGKSRKRATVEAANRTRTRHTKVAR